MYSIPFILFSILLVMNVIRKKSILNISSLIISLFIACGACAAFLGFTDHFDNGFGPHFLALLYFSAGIILFLLPFYIIKENTIEAIRIENPHVLQIACYVLIALSFFTLFYDLPQAWRGLHGDIRSNRMSMVSGSDFERGGLLNTISSASSALFPVVWVLFFLVLATKQSKVLATLLFLATFGYVMHTLSYIGRTGLFYWPVTFLYAFLLFKKFLSKKVKRKILLLGAVGVTIVMIPMVLITISRFSADPVLAFIDYGGQSVKNANDFFQVDLSQQPCEWGQESFPLVYEILEKIGLIESRHYSTADSIQNAILELSGLRTFVFSSFLKSFYIDFGFIGALALGLLFTFIVLLFGKIENGVISFRQIIMLTMFFQWPAQGMFYFILGSRGGNLFMVNAFIFFLILKFTKSEDEYLIYTDEYYSHDQEFLDDTEDYPISDLGATR